MDFFAEVLLAKSTVVLQQLLLSYLNEAEAFLYLMYIPSTDLAFCNKKLTILKACARKIYCM